MPARLTVYLPDQPARQFPLDPERSHLIGRGPDCDLRIEDSRLSRRHAEIAVSGGCWRFGDLGSKNGTTLAGREPGEATLRDGDWISFGGLLGRFAELTEAQVAAIEHQTRTRWDDTVGRSRRLDPKADVHIGPRVGERDRGRQARARQLRALQAAEVLAHPYLRGVQGE